MDISLVDAGLAWTVWESGAYFGGGEVPQATGTRHRRSTPYQAYRTADGYVTIGAANDRLWQRLINDVLGKPEWAEDPRFATLPDRMANIDELEREIEAITTTRTDRRVDRELDKAGVARRPGAHLRRDARGPARAGPRHGRRGRAPGHRPDEDHRPADQVLRPGLRRARPRAVARPAHRRGARARPASTTTRSSELFTEGVALRRPPRAAAGALTPCPTTFSVERQRRRGDRGAEPAPEPQRHQHRHVPRPARHRAPTSTPTRRSRSIVLRGAGEKSFASGADISEFEQERGDAAKAAQLQRVRRGGRARDRGPDQADDRDDPRLLHRRRRRAGAGVRPPVRRRPRRFAITPAKLGLVYSLESTKRLVDLAGPSRAKWILMSGQQIQAERALQLGLFDELVRARASSRPPPTSSPS